jgi:hypothetical protein
MSALKITSLLEAWGLSQGAIGILEKEPEIVRDLMAARAMPPFEREYVPNSLEIRFDDVTFIRYERGKLPYCHPCSPDYNPPFTEYCLDGETALFHVDGEIVVDRTQNLDLAKIRQSFL